MDAPRSQSPREFLKLASVADAGQLRDYCTREKIELPVDDAYFPGGAMAQPVVTAAGTAGNRWAILPMEGWDGTPEGHPTDLTRRRWRNFGASGAGLIWGGEAVAVRHDGRANPRQLVLNQATAGHFVSLREELLAAHREAMGEQSTPVIGLQLTHSGRWARPNPGGRLEPWIAYHHPILDRRSASGSAHHLMTDDDFGRLIEDFIAAGVLAAACGFDFVDIKHCHGYLGHELLGAVDRPGRFGGSLENRSRFLVEVAEGLKAKAPGLGLGVRLSMFDALPYTKGPGGVGVPEEWMGPYPYAFGGDGTGVGFDLAEPVEFLRLAHRAGVRLVCTTAASPYYNPHLQRPAAQPPSDGYLTPEEPLAGVARQIRATGDLKNLVPGMVWVGSGYSYLQDWLGPVAQAVVRAGLADMVGLGRMVLSYPTLPRDLERGQPIDRKRICRTLSDCTTAPRNGLVSGCYPLDPFYKARPEALELRVIKERLRGKT
jgi:2,4-dienoyl-CoA reductase-like NADH-dependent reductase (Old Yellow Enzyme family)